jgi:hypothetical protein
MDDSMEGGEGVLSHSVPDFAFLLGVGGVALLSPNMASFSDFLGVGVVWIERSLLYSIFSSFSPL